MRLLLAEDEKELSNAIVTILKHSNYTVDAVDNGEDAFDYLETGAYDGAVLDIMMPKMDGITVVRKLRASGNRVPVLFLTAKSEIDDRVLGLDSGADDYLTKPFAAKELLARIRAITRRHEAESADNLLRFASVTLNRATYELASQNASVRLANKEYQMMEMLMANSRQVIPAERFLEKIWGYDTDVELNIVWVYISNLRKKLVSLEADVQIKAHRNVGYSLEVTHE